ncbi:MAG: hypothetical protein RIR70_451 [Pseudomonadota bacterium]
MGNTLSRLNPVRSLEMASYQRFNEGRKDVFWSTDRSVDGHVNLTSHFLGLMGESSPGLNLLVRDGSDAARAINEALAAFHGDNNLATAWKEIMVDGRRVEGVKHLHTLVTLGALDLNHPWNPENSLLHDMARNGGATSQDPNWDLDNRFKWLRDAGVDMNLSCNGSTPLHAAVDAGNFSAVEALLAADADPGRLDASGHTPLDIARRRQEQLSGDPEAGGLRTAQEIVGSLQVFAAVPPDQPTAPVAGDKWGALAAKLSTASGLALTGLGLGALLGGWKSGRQFASSIDSLEQAQLKKAEEIAATDSALVAAMSNSSAAQVGPIANITLEEAKETLENCLRAEKLEDFFEGGWNPGGENFREPASKLGDLEAPIGNRQPPNLVHKPEVIDLGAIGGAISTPPSPQDDDIRQIGDKLRDGIGGAISTSPSPKDDDIRQIGDKLRDGISDPLSQARGDEEDFPCRNEFLQWQVALSALYNKPAAVGVSNLRSEYLNGTRDTARISGGLAGGGLLLLSATFGALMARKLKASKSRAQSASSQ